MKRKLSILTVMLLILSTFFTACSGDKAISGITITGGLEYTYEVGSTPDFSKVTANVTYNDDSVVAVTASDLTFSELDTSKAGTKKLTITYNGFSITVDVTVKDKVAVDETPDVVGIEIMASTVKTSLIVGETLDTTGIKVETALSDGSVGTIDAENLTFSVVDTAEAGEKTLTVTYGEFSDTITITVHGITGIEVDGDSVNTTVEIGEEIDLTNLKVYAIYSNGVRAVLSNDDLVITEPDTATEGDKELVIAYGTFEARIPVSSVPPTLTGIKINVDSYAPKVTIGSTYDLSTITVTASYSNNTTKQITASSLTISAIDTSVAGEATITVTFEDMTDSVTITVLGIKSVTIDQSSVNGGKVNVLVGTNFDLSKVKAIITYTDDSKTTVSAADGLTVGTIDTFTEGKQTLKVSYKGVEGSLSVTVSTPAYEVTDVALPASLSAFYSNRESDKFKEKNANARYIVGDDNPFKFALTLYTWDTANNKPGDNVTSYIGISNVYLVTDSGETLLTGKALTDMVSVNNVENTFDFTDAAVGNKFRIETRPRYNIDDSNIANYTRSVDITVVNAYNIYSAKELNLLTNNTGKEIQNFGQGTKNQLELCNDFLANNNIKRPANLAGIVFHSDITITKDDLPSDYFYNYTNSKGEADSGFYDFMSVYHHNLDETNKTFDIHGNYFGLYSYNLPDVCEKGNGDNEDEYSSSELFRFDITDAAINNAGTSFDFSQYKYSVNNLFVKGDDPNSNNVVDASRHIRGLIAFKTCMSETTMTNVRVEAYMLGIVAHADQQRINLESCIFYNAWQGHLYLWSTNRYQESFLGTSGEAPVANYYPITVNITNSELTKCGGPVVIADYAGLEKACNSLCGVDVKVDAASKLSSYVTGEEVWFSANNVAPLALQILAMNEPISQMAQMYQTTAGITSTSNPGMTNIASANLIFANRGPRGKMTLEGKGGLNMSDPTVSAVAAGLKVQSGGQDVPVFQAASTAIGAYVPQIGIFDPLTQGVVASEFFVGDTMSLYMGELGVLVEYYH